MKIETLSVGKAKLWGETTKHFPVILLPGNIQAHFGTRSIEYRYYHDVHYLRDYDGEIRHLSSIIFEQFQYVICQ